MSAGAGINFSNADHSIFVSESYSNIDALQSKARLNVFDGLNVKWVHYLLASESAQSRVRDTMIVKEARTNQIYENNQVRRR